jgi:L-rhamnose mutarotase
MWRFQRALPHAAPGEKWVAMHRIFDMTEQEA